MLSLNLPAPGSRLSVLCLGAHSDDIEIGLGGTLLSLMARGIKLDVHWCVLSAVGDREAEARNSAVDFLSGAATQTIETLAFRDGFFPEQGEAIKSWFEDLKSRVAPDLIFTHRRDDAHQDHREVCRLTWNTFRDHFILEYEIPKWDGDLGPAEPLRVRARRASCSARSSCWTSISRPSDPSNGSMPIPSRASRGCGEWNAARPSDLPKASSRARYRCSDAGQSQERD